MQIAFLGFGLIGGSIARAVRANPATKDWTMAAWSPSRRGTAQGRGRRRHRCRRRERRKPSCATPTSIVLAGAGDRVPAAHRPLAGQWRTHDPARRDRDRRRQHEGGDRRPGRCGRACGSSAATRWPASRTPATRRPTPTCSSIGRGSSSRVPSPAPADVERVTELADACRAGVVRMDAARHDRAVAAISHLPLRRRRRARRGRRDRPGDAESRAAARADGRSPRVWPRAAGAT